MSVRKYCKILFKTKCHAIEKNVFPLSLPSKLLMNCLICLHSQVIYVALPNLKMLLESSQVKRWIEVHSQEISDEDEKYCTLKKIIQIWIKKIHWSKTQTELWYNILFI